MEKRIGTLSIIVSHSENIAELNGILSEFAPCILSRQGLPLHDRGISIITLVIEADMNTISALSGKIGRLKGVSIKSMVAKQ